VIAGQKGHAQNHASSNPSGMHDHVHTVSVMTETANRLLAALSPEQRAKAVFPFRMKNACIGSTFQSTAKALRWAK